MLSYSSHPQDPPPTNPASAKSITCCICNRGVCCTSLSAPFPSSAPIPFSLEGAPRWRIPVYFWSDNTLCGQQSWHLLAGLLGGAKDWIMMTVELRHELGRFNRTLSYSGRDLTLDCCMRSSSDGPNLAAYTSCRAMFIFRLPVSVL